VAGIDTDWAMAWAVYSTGTSLTTILAVLVLHSRRMPIVARGLVVVALVALLVMAWGGMVAVLVDNCGAGGDCDPYKGVHGWPSGKAIFFATLPIAGAALVSETLVRLSRYRT
jgi:hypothetical protein